MNSSPPPLEVSDELGRLFFLFVALLTNICIHGWIGLEEGNKGIDKIIDVKKELTAIDTVRWTLSSPAELCPVQPDIVRQEQTLSA
jgi:hypothetical protein